MRQVNKTGGYQALQTGKDVINSFGGIFLYASGSFFGEGLRVPYRLRL